MADPEEQIIRLEQALRLAKDASDSEEEEDIAALSNRGHKLEAGSRYVSSRTLNVPVPSLATALAGTDGDKLDLEVAKLLQPISDPAEVASHPAIRDIMVNPFLKQLSDELMDRLVADRQTLANVVKLHEAFLGDDDQLIMPEIMANTEEPAPYPTPEPNQPPPKVEEDVDAFFRVPQIDVDKNHGLEPEKAARVQQQLQVVLQRLEEYVRYMTEMRLGLLCTLRLRRSVLNWCREMNGDDYVKMDLDEQNGADNSGLGDQPAKDVYQQQHPQRSDDHE